MFNNMRKKIFTLLTLLATVCSGAWATTYVSQDYSDGVADWTSGITDRYTVAVDGYLTVNAVGNGNNGTTITGTTVNGKLAAGTDFASSTDFTMTFDLQLNGGNNQASTFFIYDAANAEGTALLKLAQTTKGSNDWIINDNSGQTVTLTKSTWYSFVLSKKGSLLYLTVTPTAGGDAAFAQASITVLSTKGGTGNMIFNTKRYYSFMAIDNVVLRDWESGDTPTGTATTYTITYKNESDETIAESVEGNGLVGDAVTATAAQMADITHSEQKYIYKSGNEEITLVADAASNVINLVYREANSYTYKLTSSLGTVFANSSGAENDVVYVPFAQYELSGTTLYSTSADGTDGNYRNKYTLTENIDETKTYTANTNNVVYFSEGEKISGATASSSGNANIRCSMGEGGYFSSETDIVTLPAGTYTIYTQVWGGSGTAFTFTAGDETIHTNTTTGSLNPANSSFTLTESTTIKISAVGGASKVLDWVYIVKTGEVATIGSHGYATFSSTYALDFSGVSGMKAYKVTGVADNEATLDAVTTAPANTGLILIGTAGSYNIPIVASADAIDDNKLVAVSADDTPVGTNNYVLVWDKTASTVKFVKAGEATLNAGQAYLSGISSARSLSLVFEGETSGINNAQIIKSNETEGIFNLSGQRVAKPTKGLYIVNGKKMLVK